MMKKTTKKENRKTSGLLKLVTVVAVTIAALWLLGKLIPALGVGIGNGTGIFAAIVAIVGVMSWKQGKSPLALVKDWFAGLKKDEDEEEDEEDETVLPDGYEIVEARMPEEGTPIKLVVPEKANWPEGKVPTLQKNGAGRFYMGWDVPKKASDAPKGYELDVAGNCFVKKAAPAPTASADKAIAMDLLKAGCPTGELKLKIKEVKDLMDLGFTKAEAIDEVMA